MTGKRLLGLAVLPFALSSCSSEPETFDVTGTINIVAFGSGLSTYNPDAAGEDFDNPSGAEVGSRCSGGDAVPGFNEGDEIIIEDADGTRVAVGELSDGELPEGFDSGADLGMTACRMEFTVTGVPAGDGIFVARIGEEEVSFSQGEASNLEFDVSNA